MQSALEKEERFMCSLEEDGESLWFLDTRGCARLAHTATQSGCCCSSAWLGESRDRFAGVQ